MSDYMCIISARNSGRDYETAFIKGYEQGRADAIDEVIKSLKVQFLMQNNPTNKLEEAIVLRRDFINALEQLKEQNNDKLR